jgi:phage FluMu gp28-like protein
MYKIEIDISAWGGDEKVTIETSDFDKIELIREFIEFQQENGWAADYEQVAEDDEEEEVEDEDEAVTVSTYIITKIED